MNTSRDPGRTPWEQAYRILDQKTKVRDPIERLSVATRIRETLDELHP